MRRILLCVAVVMIYAGCELHFANDPCRCIKVTDSDIVRLGVHVVDKNGAPVTNLDFVVLVKQTGDTLSIFQSGVSRGYYIYATDYRVQFITSGGEWVQARGFSPTGKLLLLQSFHIDADNCDCHVTKLFGPDTIRLQ
jgi:hypothetical protein